MRLLPTLLAALLPLLLASCQWDPWIPQSKPPDPSELPKLGARSLSLDVPIQGELDCGAGVCGQWFRLDNARAGELRIEADVRISDSDPVARLVLQDLSGRVMTRATAQDGLPLRVRSPVAAGRYYVLLQTAGQRRFTYVLEAELRSGTR